MLLKVYSVVLGAYPTDFRKQFASEMLVVFEQRAASFRSRGAIGFANFFLKEIAGAISGALRERIGNRPLALRQDLALPVDALTAETYLKDVSAKLISAIANHDFVNARYYDEQERRTRALLTELRAGSTSLS